MLVFLAIYTGVFFQLNDRRLGAMVSWLVTRSVRGRFTLGRAHYDYWGGLWSIVSNRPTHVTGGDFEMLDPDGGVVMRVPHVEAEVHLRELIASLLHYAMSRHFHLRLHFSSAQVPGGYAIIAPTHSSFGTQKPEMNIVAAMTGKKPPTDDRGELSIEVDDIALGPIEFGLGSSNPQGQLSWLGRLDGARAHGRLSYSSSKRKANADGPAFFFFLRDVEVGSGALTLGDFAFPLVGLKAAFFGTVPPSETGTWARAPAVGAPEGFGPRQTLAFDAVGLTLGGHVRASGALVDAYGPHPGVRLRLELEHGRGLASLLPDPVASWIGGDPRGVVTIEGPFSDVTIGGEVEGAIVDIGGLHLANAGGRMTLADGGLLKLDRLHGDLGRGQLRGRLDLRLTSPGSWRAELDASSIDPATLPPVPASLRRLLGGRFGGHLRLGGAFGRSARGSAIDIQLTGGNLERSASDPLPRKLELEGKIAYLDGQLGVDRVGLRGEGLALEASGRVALAARPSAELDFSLAASRGGWLGRVGLPSDLQIDRAIARGHVGGPLASIEGRAQVDLQGLVVRGRRFDQAHAEVSLVGGQLRIPALTGEGLGAGLAGRGALRLFEVGEDGRTRLDRRLAEPTIEAQLHADGANLSEVFGTIGVGGRADMEVQLSGALTHPTGHASLSVPELSLLGDRYRKGRLAFDFSDQGAKVSALHLERIDGGLLEGTGLVGWQGALDLDLAPRDFPLAAIPGVSSLPVAVLGTLSGKVHLGGDLGRPQPGGIISLVGAKIRDTFFGDGSLRLDPGADAIHVTGKFFQSYTVDGYLTLFPKISTAVTVTFKDIELERIFPEMRRLADVRGKASGEARITADAEGGLTFAGLKLTAVSLVLSGIDETGRARRLVVRNQEDVTLSTDGHTLLIDRCYLRSALGGFSIHGRITQKDTDVDLRGHIGLELLEYFFASFFQRMSGDAMVDLKVKGDLSARPKLLGSLDLRRAHLQPAGLEGHQLFVPSGLVGFEPDGIRLKGLKVELDGAVLQASGRIALDGYKPGAIQGDLSGDLSARFLQWARPNDIDEATGRISINAHLGGTWQRPEWRGEAQIKDVRVSLRRSGREVLINEGTLRLNNYDIVIGCESANLGSCKAISGLVDDESRFSLKGKIGFGDQLFLRTIALHGEASDLSYNGGDFAVRVSPSLDLSGDGRQLELTGLVNLVEGRYTRNFDLVGLLFTPQRAVERPEPIWEGRALLEQMRLDLRAKSTGPLTVRNNIADLSFSADLSIGGTLHDPTLGGEVGVEQGGSINNVCRFPLVTNRSQLTFDPEKRYPDTPSLQISATGVLVSDRTDAAQNIRVQVLGPLGGPQLQLSTQQGLQDSDALLMCVSGMTADELRRGGAPSSGGPAQARGIGAVQGTSTTEGVAKTATGALVSSALDPLRKVVRLDTFSLEFGATGVDLRACKRWTQGFKTCGAGELGFIGGSRVGGYAEYRFIDGVSVLGRGEYLTRGVETIQESLTRGRLELDFRLPLVW